MIYIRRVNYYETDQMAVVHHSNYIKYLEEARIKYLDNCGVPYIEMEKCGLISPVLHIEGDYVKSLHFDEDAYIEIIMSKYTGIKLEFNYIIRNKDNEICFRGSSKHCLLKNNELVSLKKINEEWDRLLRLKLNS